MCGAAADAVVGVVVAVAVAATRITAAKASSGSVGLGRTFTASIVGVVLGSICEAHPPLPRGMEGLCIGVPNIFVMVCVTLYYTEWRAPILSTENCVSVILDRRTSACEPAPGCTRWARGRGVLQIRSSFPKVYG